MFNMIPNSLKIGAALVPIFNLLLGANSSTTFSENDIPEFDYLNVSADPCDDFYRFSCGNFEKIHPRPSSLNIIDHFVLLEENLVEIGKEILSTPKSPTDPVALRKAKSAYRACTNVHFVADNMAPQLLTVEEVGGMPLLSPTNATNFSWNEIGDLVGQYGVPLILTFTVSQVSQNESVIRITSDSLGNPALFRPRHQKSYEEVLEESFEEMGRSRAKRASEPAPFDVFLQTLAKHLLQQSNVNKSDEEVVDELNDMANFMRQLYAGGIIDGDVLPLETQITIEQLQEWTHNQFNGDSDLDWIDYLNRIFRLAGVEVTNSTRIYHPGPEFLYGVLNLIKQTDAAILKNFALLRVFLFQAPDSDHSTRKAFENYYAAKGYQLYTRRDYCARKILDVVDTASLSYAVTYAYERYHYDIDKITRASEMIENILDTFGHTVHTSSWMDAESRDAALEKIRNMLVLLGYPDFVDDSGDLDAFYANFRICEHDSYGNARSIRAFKQAYQFSQLGSPDRTFWGKSTFDPNAYYNRPNNKIVIPISMLNPVFFYGDNVVLDYSRLGSIIGHEITHGFDVNGKNYDQDGLFRSWWTDATMGAYEEKTTCFVDQYSKYYVEDIRVTINGSYSINENLADNGGVRQSFKAFKKYIEDKDVQTTGTYSIEQLFFIGYATMWCSEESTYALQVLVSSQSGYPPNKYRVIGSLSNMEEFSEAFDCPVGSKMNPENKCLLW